MRKKFDNFVIFIGLIAVLQFQPGILGHNYAWLVLAITAVVCLLMFLSSTTVKIDALLFLALVAFSLYKIFILIVSGTAELVDVNSLVLDFVGVFLIVVLYSKARFFNFQLAYTSIFFIVAILSVLTTVLRFESIVALNADLVVPIKNYDAGALLYYPFGLFYRQLYGFDLYELLLPRLIGVYREPGLMQAFFSAGVVLALKSAIGLKKKYTCVFFGVIGIIFTNSTAAIVSLVFIFFVFPFYVFKNFIYRCLSIGVVAIAFFAVFDTLLNLDSVGILAKLSDSSGEDRVNAFGEFFNLIHIAPMLGLISVGQESLIASQSGSLPLFVLRHGILGFFVSILPFVFIIFRSKKIDYIAFFPLFISALTSQPLWATIPFLGFFVLICSHTTCSYSVEAGWPRSNKAYSNATV